MKEKMLFAFWAILTLSNMVAGHPLCSDTTAPVEAQDLQFCTQYRNSSCCLYDSNTGGRAYRETAITANFTALGVPINTPCGQLLQKIMCTKCEPWSAHLRGDLSNERSVPILCGSFCSNFYQTCRDVTMNQQYSPFGTSLISSVWPTELSFCNQTYAAYEGYCFNGSPYVDPTPPDFNSNKGFCLDRVVSRPTGEAHITIAAIDSKVILATRTGMITAWRVTPRGPFQLLGTFLDLTSRVYLNGEGGLLGMAYHPTNASRFFISYICSPILYDDCRWNRTCTVDKDCLFGAVCLQNNVCGCRNNSNCLDGGVCTNGNCMGPGGVSNHVQMTIIAEYTVNPANENQLIATETKRVIEASRPGANHNGGQILFGPDGYLYAFMGDGGGNGARSPQDSRSFMGKVLRVDINTPSNQRYAIPATNPFVNNPSYRPEIYAEGLRNPWRSSFDKLTGTLWTGDVGDVTIEEINQILPGRNYGWRKFEGSIQWNSDALDPKPLASQNTLPKMSYTHLSMQPSNGACVIGGHWYRGTKNNCWNGKYLFSDQLNAFFAGTEDPPVGSGLYEISRVSWKCGSDSTSAIKCNPNGKDVTFTSIFSLGEDAAGNIYWLTDQGVFQLIEPSRCPTIDCNANNTVQATTASPVGTTGAVSATTGRVIVSGDYDLVCATSLPILTGSALPVPICDNCVLGGFDRINTPPFDSSLFYTINGIQGIYNPSKYNGTGVVFVFAEVGTAAQQTLQARIRYDFNGDGVWDRIEIFDKRALDNVVGWEKYEQSDVTKRFFAPNTRGAFQNMTDGSVELTLWQSSGNSQITVKSGGTFGQQTSYIDIPFTYISETGTTCNYLVLGPAPPQTTGDPTTGIPTTGIPTTAAATTGEATTGAAATSAATTAKLPTSMATTQPVETTQIDSKETGAIQTKASDSESQPPVEVSMTQKITLTVFLVLILSIILI